MDIFLARQPIFDKDMQVFAYEILYRSGQVNSFDSTDGDKASANVMLNSFQNFGLEKISNNRPVFINFTEYFLTQEIATLFPKKMLVVEILENVLPRQEIIEKCLDLKTKGYTIALDDFVYSPEFEPLLKIADIIKIDFVVSSRTEIVKMLSLLKRHKLKLLAEKVETREEFEFAKKLGFELFQGFFFSKPEILSDKSFTPLEINHLHLISKLNQEDVDFEEITGLVSRDIALTYSLFKLVRSAYFGYNNKSNSVKQALVFLGIKELKKWLTLLALTGLNKDKPEEIMRQSLIRARFAEILANDSQFTEQAEDYFLAGLFSMLDVILEKPLEVILEEIKVSEDIKTLILGQEEEAGVLVKIIRAYERGDWEKVQSLARVSDVRQQAIIDAYVSSLMWYQDNFASLA